ncbi:hypothetical protein [Bacillus sp. Marseille-P3661]|uniref:hypothetical protein n=1 Tax=Bacillus sp. Marseille-P3661 TaxID=1936234 RepID=UPI000C821B53|nr:hypothetical protein [Bacillus sp. Marseille-P3661]
MNIRKNLLLTITLILAMSLFLVGCGGNNQSGTTTEEPPANEPAETTTAEKVVLKLGHGAQESHPLQTASLKFKEIVEEKTEGAIEVQVFGNRQLGEERAMVEGLQIGTVELTIVDTAPVIGFFTSNGSCEFTVFI